MSKKKANQNNDKLSCPTCPNDSKYFENIDLWRNPTGEFIGMVYTELAKEWTELNFLDCLKLRNQSYNIKQLVDLGLLEFADNYFEAKFENYKIYLLDNLLKSRLFDYLKN